MWSRSSFIHTFLLPFSKTLCQRNFFLKKQIFGLCFFVLHLINFCSLFPEFTLLSLPCQKDSPTLFEFLVNSQNIDFYCIFCTIIWIADKTLQSTSTASWYVVSLNWLILLLIFNSSIVMAERTGSEIRLSVLSVLAPSFVRSGL